jgi:hypothetical protein
MVDSQALGRKSQPRGGSPGLAGCGYGGWRVEIGVHVVSPWKKFDFAKLIATPELSPRGLQAQRSAAASDHSLPQAGAASMLGIVSARHRAEAPVGHAMGGRENVDAENVPVSSVSQCVADEWNSRRRPPSQNYIPVKLIAKQWLANISHSGGSVQIRPSTDTQRPCSEKASWVLLRFRKPGHASQA